MKERIDTFQVGPAAPGLIEGLVEDVIPAVLIEARKTADGRTISVGTTVEKHGNESTGWVFIEYKGEDITPFSFDKYDTVVTDHFTAGVYPAVEPEPE